MRPTRAADHFSHERFEIIKVDALLHHLIDDDGDRSHQRFVLKRKFALQRVHQQNLRGSDRKSVV